MLFIATFICCYINSHSQDILASTMKIGPFSLGMKQTEVEAILLKKIPLADIKNSNENYEKPVSITFNGTTFKLGFMEVFSDKGELTGKYKVNRIICDDKNVKTKSGLVIGMGSMQAFQLLSAMDISFTYNKSLQYDDAGKPLKKYIESIRIYDTKAEGTLQLNIKDGKIATFELGYDENGG